MVCIPCIVVPVFLFFWHRFLQPLFLKFWNPFGKKDDKKTDGTNSDTSQTTTEVNDKEEKDTTVMETEMGNKPKRVKTDFPTNLEDFGYIFNEDGVLKDKETGGPFQFVIKEDDHKYNQTRYEALGEIMTEHIYELLEKDCKLKRLSVPKNAKKDDPQTFIFASDDAFTNTDKLMVLIHGSGVVRAGQWARRLIINDSLNSGTQIPFIKRGMKEGYGILVMNTNDNFVKSHKGKTKRIPGSENPECHATSVWEEYISDAKAKEIYIVAHSFGGVVTTNLYKNLDDFNKRVTAIAFTDSVHFINSARQYKTFIQKAINWVVSKQPLDTRVRRVDPVMAVSSGADTHEKTSWASYESIFKFFKDPQAFMTKIEEQELPSERSPQNPSSWEWDVDDLEEENEQFTDLKGQVVHELSDSEDDAGVGKGQSDDDIVILTTDEEKSNDCTILNTKDKKSCEDDKDSDDCEKKKSDEEHEKSSCNGKEADT